MDKMSAFISGFEKKALKSKALHNIVFKSMRFLDPKSKLKGFSIKGIRSTRTGKGLKRD